LRVEIDHSKRAASVEALTESDFFKDLQTRSSDLRQKMKDDLAAEAEAEEGPQNLDKNSGIDS